MGIQYGYPKTHAFFKKYSSRMWILLAVSMLFWSFVPQQKRHYLAADIDDFSDAYYVIICVVLSASIVLSLFFIVWRKATIRKAFISLVPGVFIALCFSFFGKSMIIGTCLWINRFSEKEEVQYTYWITSKHTESKIITELKTSRMLYKDDVRNMELYRSSSYLHASDTFHYTFNKGLLGIKYIPDEK